MRARLLALVRPLRGTAGRAPGTLWHYDLSTNAWWNGMGLYPARIYDEDMPKELK